MGYQLVLADLNRDKRLDVIVVDERAQDLAWYENPTWARHVLATAVPRVINLDTHDLDGDGIPEIALAHRFETDPARSVGQVLLLTHGDDPTQSWTSRPIDAVPTAHRVRWMRVEAGKAPWLIVAPFAGAGVVAPKYEGRTPIYAYRPGTWVRQTDLVDAHRHRARHPAGGVGAGPMATADGEFRWPAAAGTEGRRVDARADHFRQRRALSAVRQQRGQGRHARSTTLPRDDRTVPWHNVVVYLDRPSGWDSLVIERGMTNGHALAVADLDGDGRDEIIGGFRGKDFRITIYRADDATGTRWTPTVLDQGHVAGADCKVADLTGDGRLDIVCSGASTGNVMLFEQQPRVNGKPRSPDTVPRGLSAG